MCPMLDAGVSLREAKAPAIEAINLEVNCLGR